MTPIGLNVPSPPPRRGPGFLVGVEQRFGMNWATEGPPDSMGREASAPSATEAPCGINTSSCPFDRVEWPGRHRGDARPHRSTSQSPHRPPASRNRGRPAHRMAAAVPSEPAGPGRRAPEGCSESLWTVSAPGPAAVRPGRAAPRARMPARRGRPRPRPYPCPVRRSPSRAGRPARSTARRGRPGCSRADRSRTRMAGIAGRAAGVPAVVVAPASRGVAAPATVVARGARVAVPRVGIPRGIPRGIARRLARARGRRRRRRWHASDDVAHRTTSIEATSRLPLKLRVMTSSPLGFGAFTEMKRHVRGASARRRVCPLRVKPTRPSFST